MIFERAQRNVKKGYVAIVCRKKYGNNLFLVFHKKSPFFKITQIIAYVMQKKQPLFMFAAPHIKKHDSQNLGTAF